jgi:uncharacterized protein DUF4386
VTPRATARTAGALWLVVFVASAVALARPEATLSSVLIKVGTLAYVAVTVLLYDLLKPVNPVVALLAAVAGLVGSVMSWFHLNYDDLFFGMQCILVGYLIYKSAFLPRVLGVLLAIAGLALLTFVSPTLKAALSPYNLGAAMIGEFATALWLLIGGVTKWAGGPRSLP